MLESELRPEIAVSAGAIIRASNKEDGPARYLQSSYGVLRHEERDLELEGHRKGGTTWRKEAGAHFVSNTLLWVFKKVGDATRMTVFSLLICSYLGRACGS